MTAQQVLRGRVRVMLVLLGLAVSSPAAGLPSGFQQVLVANGLSNPIAMQFAPDGRLFVCQQTGQLRVIKNGALLATPFLTVTVNSSGERGLLGDSGYGARFVHGASAGTDRGSISLP